MAIALTLEPWVVPLTRLDNGVYRVKGTRIPLERVVESYKDGATPEDIVDAFDTLRLADAYILLGYYLDHKEEVEQYLREQEEDGEEMRRMIEASQPPRPGFREELLRRKALMEQRNAEAEAVDVGRLIGEALREADENDPLLESYQKYKGSP